MSTGNMWLDLGIAILSAVVSFFAGHKVGSSNKE